jgi:hypothetical protein
MKTDKELLEMAAHIFSIPNATAEDRIEWCQEYEKAFPKKRINPNMILLTDVLENVLNQQKELHHTIEFLLKRLKGR